MDELTTIPNFKPDDPIPDLAMEYPIGYIITHPDGRRWRRAMFGQWDLVVPTEPDLTLSKS